MTAFPHVQIKHTNDHAQQGMYVSNESGCSVSVEITNKMQPCIGIYYSSVHWRLNMFRAAYRSSSGAL